MVKTTFKQLEKRFNSVYMASNFYLSIWTCWNIELQQVQVNQCPDFELPPPCPQGMKTVTTRADSCLELFIERVRRVPSANGSNNRQ